MRSFASWWERLPMRQVGAVIAVVAVIGFVSVQASASSRAGRGEHHIQLPTGEVWG